MKESVLNAFPQFTARFEGTCSWMYLDVLGLVTTGVGNLIDPIGAALGLPWLRKSDNVQASQSEIISEWRRVKSLQALAKNGGFAFRSSAALYLEPAAVAALVLARMKSNEVYIASHIDGWSDLPADAQLGIHSIAWAEGAAFEAKYPRFLTHLSARQLDGAAEECTIAEAGNPGVVPRNVQNRICFHNAARVLEQGRNPDILCWPMVMPLPAGYRPSAPLNVAPLVEAEQPTPPEDLPPAAA